MERGSSIPWQETLREATGEFRLDGSALREYFRPLEDWLRTENLRTGEVVGWSYGKGEREKKLEGTGRLNLHDLNILLFWPLRHFLC